MPTPLRAAAAARNVRGPRSSCGRASQSATNEPKSIWRSFASTGAASRKCTSMNSPSLSAMRCWLPWMIAVCGIGRPSGRLNSATTAYQSARPPMVAASAKAAMKPKAGCTGSIHFAPMKIGKRRRQHQRRQQLDAAQLRGARGVAGRVDHERAGKCQRHDGFRTRVSSGNSSLRADVARCVPMQAREAISCLNKKAGLLRRFAPRNDEETASP